ncbi:heme biosynthesis protein HemY [Falsigemmobacter faecalis]|uniref:Heme biosynthesis protein HemY n=1 Tax=Falsigemmobacter faecalis TaxID=2488730 RepID=A0A3P3DRK3_9RHOB|nr:heme biosynthesis HemY N-terminal domain-containing protein [Falsigemmobacter faecalis]RRH76574.1 heme biosynthesis protein HemY [Falsigemmobacter faecalis]
MPWTLIKAILFFVILALLAWVAAALSSAEGGIRIAMLGKEITLAPLQAVIASVVLVFGLWLMARLIGLLLAAGRFFAGDDTALSRYFSSNRERRGLNALSEAMIALASGENRVAMARAEKAQRLLDRPELTSLIEAEAAQAAGDRPRAEAAYRRLLSDDRARFVAVRGLLKLKLEQGDTETALKLAEKALALKPRHNEMQDLLLQLQTGAEDWHGARATLSAKLKAGALPKDVWKRRDALFALQEAKVLIDGESSIEAREAAIAANKASPDLIPAAAMAARSYIAEGKPKLATRVLKTAWEAQPHPELAAAFAEIEPQESPQARVKRFRTLTDLHPDHEETRMLLAELYIAAEDFPTARRALGDLVTTRPIVRVLTIMAAIERGMGADDAVVRGWLARALSAPRGLQWVCGSCNTIHATWVPVCNHCGGFDTLSWSEAPDSGTASPTGTEMLPLIVGKPAPPAAEVSEAATLEPAETVPAPLSEVPLPPAADPEPQQDPAKATASPFLSTEHVTPEELARRGAF